MRDGHIVGNMKPSSADRELTQCAACSGFGETLQGSQYNERVQGDMNGWGAWLCLGGKTTRMPETEAFESEQQQFIPSSYSYNTGSGLSSFHDNPNGQLLMLPLLTGYLTQVYSPTSFLGSTQPNSPVWARGVNGAFLDWNIRSEDWITFQRIVIIITLRYETGASRWPGAG